MTKKQFNKAVGYKKQMSIPQSLALGLLIICQ